MEHSKKPATRGRNGLSEIDLLGGDHSKDNLTNSLEQAARAFEAISRQRAAEACLQPGSLGRQESALASFYGRRARTLMEAAHG